MTDFLYRIQSNIGLFDILRTIGDAGEENQIYFLKVGNIFVNFGFNVNKNLELLLLYIFYSKFD